MSSVLVVAPILIATWPAISAAVAAAVGALGYTTLDSAQFSGTQQSNEITREEIEVEDSEILTTVGAGEKLVVEKEGLRATFSRDARGALRVCMEGRGYSKSKLREVGESLIGRVTQQFAYHRIMSELKARNMSVVDEELTQDQSVKIRVRNW